MSATGTIGISACAQRITRADGEDNLFGAAAQDLIDGSQMLRPATVATNLYRKPGDLEARNSEE